MSPCRPREGVSKYRAMAVSNNSRYGKYDLKFLIFSQNKFRGDKNNIWWSLVSFYRVKIRILVRQVVINALFNQKCN